jgi:hypothetical protein
MWDWELNVKSDKRDKVNILWSDGSSHMFCMEVKLWSRKTKILVKFKQQKLNFLDMLGRCTIWNKVKIEYIQKDMVIYSVTERIDNYR